VIDHLLGRCGKSFRGGLTQPAIFIHQRDRAVAGVESARTQDQ